MAVQDEHLIAPGVRGWLESPSSAIAPDCLLISGWAFASSLQILDVRVTGFGTRRTLRHGLRRDDVARAYPGEPNALHSGFAAYLELHGAPEVRRRFEVWATLDDGRSVRLFKRRLFALPAGQQMSPLRFAVREALHHPSLLLSGRSWAAALRLLLRNWVLEPNDRRTSVSGRPARAETSRVLLASFLTAGSRLSVPATAAPVVSVVVAVWNRADLTLTCLRALAAQTEIPTEVIVVDNGSTDETADLLAHVGGVRVIRNPGNLGFTLAANVGARVARGDFLLFLNNDAELLPGSIEHLLDAARRSKAVGAVGGKLVFPDGRLQEAGSIIWSDGSCEAYGRGDDPAAPEYNFERPVDFCSAALLLTPRDVFDQLGGFDERYQPAYYEDADYCARLWERGYSVVYQPNAVAIHHEFGSAMSRAASIELQRERQAIFISKHGPWLSVQLPRARGALAARAHPHGKPSVAFVDDAVPDPRRGVGFPRAAALLRALADLGYLVTIFVTGDAHQRSSNRRVPSFEVVSGGPGGLRAFFTSGRHHDFVIVSRPHNMQYVKAAVGSDLSALGAPCIYDAEAIYALREIERRRRAGQPMSEAERQALIDAELSLTRGCAAVLTVSAAEQQLFAAAGVPTVCVLGHAVEPQGVANGFERRRTILFVGAFGADSPNEDAILFFCRDLLPALRTAGCDAPIVVAGAGIPDAVKALADPTISWHSDVDDLAPFYDDARVFVAPTRYSAGIPLKVIEAAARGVPVVSSTLLAGQLGWTSGTELLTADDPADFGRAVASLYGDREMWTRLREGGLKRVAEAYSATSFRSALRDALDRSRKH